MLTLIGGNRAKPCGFEESRGGVLCECGKAPVAKFGCKSLCAEHAEYIAMVLTPEYYVMTKNDKGIKVKERISKRAFLDRLKAQEAVGS